MKLIVLAPFVALALAGGSAGAYFWVTSEGSVEEATVAQPTATPTPTPAAKSQETPSTLAAPAEESQLASPPAQTPAVPAGWLTYTDPDFGFSIDYPPEFVVDDTIFGSLPPGMERFVRVVDKRFASDFPPGQITIFVFSKDAASPDEWVARHSASGPPPSDLEALQLFFFNITNLNQISVAGRTGVSFDWTVKGDGAGLLHTTVFFSGSHAIAIGWEASDPAYVMTAESLFEQVIATYND